MSAGRLDVNGNPSLRRVGFPSITESIHQENVRASRRVGAHVDGLGDRERSFSPEDESWATLLTTIQPDEHLPSVSSSFTSATASASAASLSSNSASSTNTAPTALSSTSDPSEMLMTLPTCDMSDSDSDSESGSDDSDGTGTVTGTEADDWDMEPTEQVDDVIELQGLPMTRNVAEFSAAVRAQLGPTDRLVDEAFDQAGLGSLRTADPATLATLPIQEMPHMRAVIERLARRRDVPDEWWGEVGLTRNVGGLRDRMRELMERLNGLENLRSEQQRQREELDRRDEARERQRLRERAQRRAHRERERERRRA